MARQDSKKWRSGDWATCRAATNQTRYTGPAPEPRPEVIALEANAVDAESAVIEFVNRPAAAADKPEKPPAGGARNVCGCPPGECAIEKAEEE